MYEVIVGNIGKVCHTDDELTARVAYSEYAEMSDNNVGRAAGESVILMKDGEIVMQKPVQAGQD